MQHAAHNVLWQQGVSGLSTCGQDDFCILKLYPEKRNSSYESTVDRSVFIPYFTSKPYKYRFYFLNFEYKFSEGDTGGLLKKKHGYGYDGADHYIADILLAKKQKIEKNYMFPTPRYALFPNYQANALLV